jgi:hypothetical protein
MPTANENTVRRLKIADQGFELGHPRRIARCACVDELTNREGGQLRDARPQGETPGGFR